MSDDTSETPLTLPPPRTVEQVLALLEAHGDFFGVCVLCGAAGHIDRLVEVALDFHSVEVCDACIEQAEKRHDPQNL
jgi:hypothetical protein